MCNFLSALVLKNGDVICHPLTDSHEELVRLAKINKDDGEAFVRVEFQPGGRLDELDKYELSLDQNYAPSWFDESCRERTKKYLIAWLEHRIVKDEQKLVIGDLCIATGASRVEAKYARITAYDSSTVKACDSSTVTACGSSTVTAYDSSTVTACACGSCNPTIINKKD